MATLSRSQVRRQQRQHTHRCLLEVVRRTSSICLSNKECDIIYSYRRHKNDCYQLQFNVHSAAQANDTTFAVGGKTKQAHVEHRQLHTKAARWRHEHLPKCLEPPPPPPPLEGPSLKQHESMYSDDAVERLEVPSLKQHESMYSDDANDYFARPPFSVRPLWSDFSDSCFATQPMQQSAHGWYNLSSLGHTHSINVTNLHQAAVEDADKAVSIALAHLWFLQPSCTYCEPSFSEENVESPKYPPGLLNVSNGHSDPHVPQLDTTAYSFAEIHLDDFCFTLEDDDLMSEPAQSSEETEGPFSDESISSNPLRQ